MQSLVDYGSEEEEEPTPSPSLSHSLPHSSPSLPHSSSLSSSSSSTPSPLPPPYPIEQNEVNELIQQEEREINGHNRGDREGGRVSPYTEEIINKLTEQMERVVDVNSWSPQSSLPPRGMERVSTAPIMGKTKRGQPTLHKSHSHADHLIHNRPVPQFPLSSSPSPSFSHSHSSHSHPHTHHPQPVSSSASSSLSYLHSPSSPFSSNGRPHSAPATPMHVSASPPTTDFKRGSFNNTGPQKGANRRSLNLHKHCHNYNTGSPKKVVNMEDWDKVYAKWKAQEDERAEKLKNRKEEKKKAEMAEASFKPRISKASDKMVNNRENIMERVAIKKAETDKKIKNLRKLQEDMMLSTIKKIPTINQNAQKLQRPQGVMEQWVLQRDKKLAALRARQKEQEEEEIKEYFKPKLNTKSVTMVSKNEDEQKDVAVRLTEKVKKRTEKLQALRKSSEHTHKPNINARSKAIKLDAPVYERLYKVGMDSILEKHKFMVDNWDFSLSTRKPLGLEAEPCSPLNENELGNDETQLEDLENMENENDDPNDINWQQYELQEKQLKELQKLQQQFLLQQQQQEDDEEEGIEEGEEDDEMQANDYPNMNGNYNNNMQMNMNNMNGYQNYNQPPYGYPQSFPQELENSGYDEDLRRMMMEAGFFQSTHANHLSADNEYEQEEEYYLDNNSYANQVPLKL